MTSRVGNIRPLSREYANNGKLQSRIRLPGRARGPGERHILEPVLRVGNLTGTWSPKDRGSVALDGTGPSCHFLCKDEARGVRLEEHVLIRCDEDKDFDQMS